MNRVKAFLSTYLTMWLVPIPVYGLFAAFGLTRLMTSILYEVDPVEPVTFAGFSAFLVAVSLLAAYLPARRAVRVDPAIVLREE